MVKELESPSHKLEEGKQVSLQYFIFWPWVCTSVFLRAIKFGFISGFLSILLPKTQSTHRYSNLTSPLTSHLSLTSTLALPSGPDLYDYLTAILSQVICASRVKILFLPTSSSWIVQQEESLCGQSRKIFFIVLSCSVGMWKVYKKGI